MEISCTHDVKAGVRNLWESEDCTRPFGLDTSFSLLIPSTLPSSFGNKDAKREGSRGQVWPSGSFPFQTPSLLVTSYFETFSDLKSWNMAELKIGSQRFLGVWLDTYFAICFVWRVGITEVRRLQRADLRSFTCTGRGMRTFDQSQVTRPKANYFKILFSAVVSQTLVQQPSPDLLHWNSQLPLLTMLIMKDHGSKVQNIWKASDWRKLLLSSQSRYTGGGRLWHLIIKLYSWSWESVVLNM